jgi:hypothetical protein
LRFEHGGFVVEDLVAAFGEVGGHQVQVVAFPAVDGPPGRRHEVAACESGGECEVFHVDGGVGEVAVDALGGPGPVQVRVAPVVGGVQELAPAVAVVVVLDGGGQLVDSVMVRPAGSSHRRRHRIPPARPRPSTRVHPASPSGRGCAPRFTTTAPPACRRSTAATVELGTLRDLEVASPVLGPAAASPTPVSPYTDSLGIGRAASGRSGAATCSRCLSRSQT